MYESFFGFKEKPFKLVSDPSFLFLGKSHEEALAYLNYAVEEGSGFVQITGEIGTGKTTLCRYFLENTGRQVIAAYIFNPDLQPGQLIRTINDELGIKYAAENTKDLTDRLNDFLLENHARGKRVVLLIDEAQQLRSEVLEQLRLLSNLETTREKLLQIILVGQPELDEVLSAYNLRQINQRIAFRCELDPLTRKETSEYIHYRTRLSSISRKEIFSSIAMDRIYRHSRGIPRLINIACDRALLTAYGLNALKVTGAIAKAAIGEVKYRTRAPDACHGCPPKRPLVLAGILLLTVMMSITYHTLTPAQHHERPRGRPEEQATPPPAAIPGKNTDFPHASAPRINDVAEPLTIAGAATASTAPLKPPYPEPLNIIAIPWKIRPRRRA